MAQYLVSIHHPENYDPSVEGPSMMQDIDKLNEEMMKAGVRIFAGGLQPGKTAHSIRKQPNAEVAVESGPYFKTNEYVGGFWILDVANLEEALSWGRKATLACRAPVEVRPFY